MSEADEYGPGGKHADGPNAEPAHDLASQAVDDEDTRLQSLRARGNRFAGIFEPDELTAISLSLTMLGGQIAAAASGDVTPEQRAAAAQSVRLLTGLLKEAGEAGGQDITDLAAALEQLDEHIEQLKDMAS